MPCKSQRLRKHKDSNKKKNGLYIPSGSYFRFYLFYPGCDLEVPDRIGDECGREWLDPAILEEEDDEDPNNPELLLDDRENGPGKLSSTDGMNIYFTQRFPIICVLWTLFLINPRLSEPGSYEDFNLISLNLQALTWIFLVNTVRLWTVSI